MYTKLATTWALLAVVFVALGAQAQVSYGLITTTALLNQDYYDGVDANGTGPTPTGRVAFFAAPSKDGTRVAFWMVSGDFAETAVFVVTIGQPDSWRRLTGDLAVFPNAPIAWTPDDGYLLVGRRKIDVLTGAIVQPDYDGITLNDASTTSMSNGNWIASTRDDALGQAQTVLLPIFRDGSYDSSREITFITNFPLGAGPNPDWPAISPDGTRLTFADWHPVTPGIADHGDIYTMKNIQAIIAAPKSSGQTSSLAPVNVADTNLTAVRTNEGGVDNFTHVPVFTQSQHLLFYVEDWNNVFIDSDFFATLAVADADVMLSLSNGAGFDVRFASANNQFVTAVTPGGVRVLYLEGNGTDFHLYMKSLRTATLMGGTSVGNPADNRLRLVGRQIAEDGSNCEIAIEDNTLVDFPDGASQEIEISTPIAPVLPSQLPDGVDGIPVVRDFGPDGTTFDTPAEVTISYTDAEIAEYDERNLRVFMYNTGTSKFDVEIGALRSRDIANNKITFAVDHFSTFGLGGAKGAGMPVGASIWVLGLLALVLAAFGGLALHRRCRPFTS